MSQTRQPLIVGAGVDTFIANVKQLNKFGKSLNEQEVAVDLSEQLQAWQDLAREQQRPYTTPLQFNTGPLLMQLGGSSTWKWVLRNAWVEVKIGARLHMGMLAKVRLSSEFLWAQPSLLGAISKLQGFTDALFGQRVYLQAAQVDLCTDMVGLELPPVWQEVFITHALGKDNIEESTKDRAYFGGRRLETIQFSGHGNPIHSKLYNKIKEIQKHSPDKVWFHDLWRLRGWNGTDTVWRKEFSLERAGLRDMLIDVAREKRLDSVYDVPKNLKRLWAYCTQDWLRMVIPQSTKNRKRWPTNPTWELVQHAYDSFANEQTEGLGPIIRKRKREKNLERVTAAIAGYASTYAAWDDTVSLEDDISVVFSKAYESVTQRLSEKGIDFAAKVQEKRALYSVPQPSQEAI